MEWLAAVGQAAMDIGGGYMEHRRATNASTDQRHFAREMWEKQMNAANTAHQRQVKDLKAAGLNPILSAKSSGATTPAALGYQQPQFQPIDTSGPIRAYTQAATAKNIQQQTQTSLSQEEVNLQNVQNLKETRNLTQQQVRNAVAELTVIQERAQLMAAQRVRELASARQLSEAAREKMYLNEYNKIVSAYWVENPAHAVADRIGITPAALGAMAKAIFRRGAGRGGRGRRRSGSRSNVTTPRGLR